MILSNWTGVNDTFMSPMAHFYPVRVRVSDHMRHMTNSIPVSIRVSCLEHNQTQPTHKHTVTPNLTPFSVFACVRHPLSWEAITLSSSPPERPEPLAQVTPGLQAEMLEHDSRRFDPEHPPLHELVYVRLGQGQERTSESIHPPGQESPRRLPATDPKQTTPAGTLRFDYTS